MCMRRSNLKVLVGNVSKGKIFSSIQMGFEYYYKYYFEYY